MRHIRAMALILVLIVLTLIVVFMYGCVQTSDIIIIEDVHVEIDYEPVLPEKL